MMDYKRYPANWKEISLSIRRDRANWRCEWCGAEQGQPHPLTGSRVILTVAHLGSPWPDGRPGNKHDKMDVRPENLAALCQRCHLNYDRDDHIVHAKENRRLKRLEQIARSGQLVLASI